MSSNRTTPQTPFTTNAPASADALRQMVATLQAENRQLQERVTEQTNRTNKNSIKYPLPTPFDGTTDTLQGFFTGARAYLHFNKDNFDSDANKVAYAASLLKGDAFAWFEPILRDYLDHKKEENRKAETNRIFDNYDNFEKCLRGTFGNPDEERTAERKLVRLTQTKSASKYASKFRQITARLPWGPETLMARFYAGLKEEVKDELVKKERPSTLAEYVELAVKIDNRQYERKLERREGRSAWGPALRQANTGRKYQHPKPPRQYSTSYGTHSGPMDLNVTQHKKPRKDPKNGKCFKCDKTGHIAKNCPGNQENIPDFRVKTGRPRGLNATNHQQARPDQHSTISWTTCYNDNCITHNSSKIDAGWYPQKPRGTRTLAVGNRVPLGTGQPTKLYR